MAIVGRRAVAGAPHVLLPERLERLKQQQDSCPSHAKQQREKVPKRRLRNALKARLSSSKNRWKSLDDVLLPERLERLKQQQDSCPSHAKQQREKVPKRRLRNALQAIDSPAEIVGRRAFAGAPRKTQTAAGFMPKPCETATRKSAETSLLRNALKARLSSSKNRWQSLDDVLLPERLERLKQQQDSCPSHAKQQREKVPKRRLRNALKARLSSSQKPMEIVGRRAFAGAPRKIQTAAGFVPKPCETATRKSAETSLTERTTSYRLSSRNRWTTCFCRSASKDSNSSRIRTQAMRNRWTTCCCRSASKDSNSSRIRAQGMRNTATRKSAYTERTKS